MQPGIRRAPEPPVHGDAEHRQHGEQQHRDGQAQGDPEPPGHAPKLGRVLVLAGPDGLRLQVHAADRATAGAGLLDLGVHRASVDDRLPRRVSSPRRLVPGVRCVPGPVVPAEELAPAALAAEVEGLAVTLGTPGGCFLDRHAADGIDRHAVALPHGRRGDLACLSIFRSY